MNLAFLLPCLKFGGAERVTLTMARSLRARGHTVTILVMQFVGELIPEAQEICPVVNLNCDKTYKLPWALSRFSKYNSPDVVLSSFWKLNLCACLSLILYPNVRLFVWEHNTFNKVTWLSRILFFLSASLLYRRANQIICVSEGVAKDIGRLSMFLSNRLITLLNPIERPPGNFLSSFRSSFSARFDIVFVGRLAPQKNVRLLLEAIRIVINARTVRLTVVGDGPEAQSLRAYASQLDLAEYVEFVGYVKSPYEFISRSRMLALSSDDEGLPSVIVQALYMGVPVVSTNSSSGVEFLLQGGRFGRIVPKGDAKALARAILEEANSPTSLLGVEDHLTLFDPVYATEQFEKLFLGGKRQ
jgi:glycosyltransferase involved in cell wall biosynthesis